MLNLECTDSVLDSRRFTAVDGAVGRHNVAGSSLDEQSTWLGLRQPNRVNSRIGTCNEQRQRILPFHQRLKQLFFLAEDVPLEFVNSFDKLLHASTPSIPTG